ncbi:MAG: zf-HC2 domain-containing protein [Candidatus Aminicenantes bacterium]|nr:zf-HC2 domain-containing protein [Candidatus Aminicenantes bacterium]
MEPCHKIRPWLEWLAAGEINDRVRARVEAHLHDCPACRRELSGWQALLASAGRRAAIAEAECRAIDWGAVFGKIMRRIDGFEKVLALPARRRIFSFAPLLTAAALLLLLGAGMFFLTRPRSGVSPGAEEVRIASATLSHLQSGLAREEVVSYLRQSQLMFTDLLKDCRREEIAAWEIKLYSRQAKELLLKKKYVQQNLPALEWFKVRSISERIDWLSYEILQLNNRPLCGQIDRLQRIMESEKLLLKIRLLEREFSLPSYQEV